MSTRLRMAAILILATLTGGLNACDRIGDPWVTDPGQYAEERSRSAELQHRLIDRAERGQKDR